MPSRATSILGSKVPVRRVALLLAVLTAIALTWEPIGSLSRSRWLLYAVIDAGHWVALWLTRLCWRFWSGALYQSDAHTLGYLNDYRHTLWAKPGLAVLACHLLATLVLASVMWRWSNARRHSPPKFHDIWASAWALLDTSAFAGLMLAPLSLLARIGEVFAVALFESRLVVHGPPWAISIIEWAVRLPLCGAALAYLIVLWLVLRWRFHAAARLSPTSRPPECHDCGYPLENLQRCPECAWTPGVRTPLRRTLRARWAQSPTLRWCIRLAFVALLLWVIVPIAIMIAIEIAQGLIAGRYF